MDGIIHALAPLKLLDIIRLYLHRPAQIAVGEPGAGKKSDFNAFCRTPRCLAGRHCIIKHHLNPSTLPSIWLVPNQRKGLAAIDFPGEARSEIQCSNIRHQNLILLRQDTKKHPDLSTLVEKNHLIMKIGS